MSIRAVLFDLDGVLVDASDWHYHALNRALALFGMEIERSEHLASYDGLPTLRKLEMLSEEKGLPRQLHRFIRDLKQSFTADFIIQHCHPVFAHEYALSRLRAQGLQLAVCSNSVRQSVHEMLSRSRLLEYLRFYLSNEDVRRPKPDPEIYLEAMKKLDLSPSECLIVEDNENGLKAAYASGAHVLRVVNPGDVHYEALARTLRQKGWHPC